MIRARRLPLLELGAVLLVVAANVFTAWGAVVPLYWQDEAGYLGASQVLAGVGEAPSLSGRPYSIGFALLIAPLWWIVDSGREVYLGAIAVSTACGVLTVLPLAAIARRLGLRRPWAVPAAAAIALAPARTIASDFATPENLLTLLVALLLLAGLRYRARPSAGRAALLGALAAAAFVVHGRAVPLLIATALWMLWELRRHPRAALAGLASSIGLAAAGFALYRAVVAQLYVSASSREDSGIARLLGADPHAVLLSGLGQLWYLVFAWIGLTVLGAIPLLARLRRELAVRRPGIAVWGALALLGTAVVSVTYIADAIRRDVGRIDIYSYGRYLDPVVVPLALLGLVLVLRGASRRRIAAAIVATAATALAWFALVWPQLPSTGNQHWFPINIMGTLQFPWRGTTWLPAAPWLYMSAAVLAALVVVLLLRRRPAVLLAMLMAVMLASTAIAELRIVRPFFSGWNGSYSLAQRILDDPRLEGQALAFDTEGLREERDSASRNAFQVLLAPRAVEVFDSSEAPPPAELVLARETWPEGERLGAVRIDLDEGVFDTGLWVLPGPLLERLEATGREDAQGGR